MKKQDPMEHEMEETYTYDSRKGILYRKLKRKGPVRDGDTELGTYDEGTVQEIKKDAIHHLIGAMKRHKEDVMQQLNSVNRTMDATKDLKEDPELEEFVQKLKDAQAYEKKMKDRNQAKGQREYLLKDMQTTEKQLRMVREAIQGHIKID